MQQDAESSNENINIGHTHACSVGGHYPQHTDEIKPEITIIPEK
jgi:hypothetical protein